MPSIASGATAGLAGTVTMTVAMEALHRTLPEGQRFPLPPRLIAEHVVDRAGAKDIVQTPRDEQLAAVVGHFGYGAATGAAYALASPYLPRDPVASGAIWGMIVWAGSYMGWLPLAGLRPLATRLPPQRELAMIAAHLVFGVSIGLTYDGLTRDGRSRGRESARRVGA
jgi:uncharacterized membrane protein YagU involved in acid resistance